MSNNDLMLDVSQAHELKLAFRRNGWTNSDIKKLSEGDTLSDVLKIIHGELTVSAPVKKWREKNGIIRFSVTFDETTGPEWLGRLEKGGNKVSDWARLLLLSENFKPSIAGVKIEVAVLKGASFSDSERTTQNIREQAEKMGLFTPNANLAPLIREIFTDKELEEIGLDWIVTMHNPIEDSDGYPRLLSADRGDVDSYLSAGYGDPGSRWDCHDGFAFVVSQV